MIDSSSGTRQFNETPYSSNYADLAKQDPDELYRGYIIHRFDGHSNLITILSTTGKPLPAILRQQWTKREYAREMIDNFLKDAT